MESNSEEELRKELEATQRRLHEEERARIAEKGKSEAKAWAREQKASDNTAQIVLFGGIALIFLLALFGFTSNWIHFPPRHLYQNSVEITLGWGEKTQGESGVFKGV